MTKGGKLDCKYIIHTVEPHFTSKAPQESYCLLQAAILNTLEMAKQTNSKSVSIPALSWDQDHFGYPKQMVVEIMLKSAINWLILNLFKKSSVKLVRFCNADKDTI